jgi:hypothetical protein
MSAAARGAAGARYIREQALGRRDRTITPRGTDVEWFVQALVNRGISEARARELAAEQQAKTFNRARSGARR